ncbi:MULTISPECIES: metallophosphoesterase family protein [Kyrpidia]|uniref:Uncharacterized protein n=2 Tax=Kyrpidia spormannii TaxID=2055160 RepID=A0ACA8ZD08_9BACL|nr:MULTISPECIES: metallophosphoesterase family protein [Kyrpidia]MCL6576756.1 metallophosphatase family protein [Kyrpidia sp.]CAB3394688.1 conserved protein of unknown function [Kyrpidia spormannii]CAB3395660.1 conserved protein of unknown function [Kyrpidia spormannii]
MRVAFLSDIHGNVEALDAVLADVRKRGVDRIAVLGDIAYRGAEPTRAVEKVRELAAAGAEVIQGNADLWTVRGVEAGEVPDPFLEIMRREQEWTAGRLTADQVRYLEELPEDIFWDFEGVRIHAFHATPTNLFTAVLPDASAEVLEGRLMVKPAVDVYVYGHIHLPYVRYLRGKCVVNTGSVGLPFDGLPQPSYALLEVEAGRFRVTLERVPYDADRAAERLRQVDYPNLQMMRVIREAISPFG